MKTKNLKPFDLQAALNGEPVMLRGGCKAFVRHHETEQPIVLSWKLWGVKVEKNGDAEPLTWSQSGDYFENGSTSDRDIIGMWPKTRIINGFEVPAPETIKPDCGTTYFTADTIHKDMVDSHEWDNDDFDTSMLERGLVFLSKEDAIANAKAMLGIDPYGEANK